jgi:hypothetical protein
MSAHPHLRSAAFALLILGLLLAMPGGALAGKPTFHDKFNVTLENIDFCGEVGTLHIIASQVITLGETTFAATGQFLQIFTTDDGRSATIQNAGTYTGTFTDNGDGTITIVDTYKGVPELILGTGGVTIRDAGIISFTTTIDLDTGEVATEVVQRGPHPDADSDFTLFCTAFLAALG